MWQHSVFLFRVKVVETAMLRTDEYFSYFRAESAVFWDSTAENAFKKWLNVRGANQNPKPESTFPLTSGALRSRVGHCSRGLLRKMEKREEPQRCSSAKKWIQDFNSASIPLEEQWDSHRKRAGSQNFLFQTLAEKPIVIIISLSNSGLGS